MASDLDELCKKLGVDAAEFAEIKRIFSKFDADGSGTIDVNELALLLKDMGGEYTDEEIHLTLTQIDTDKVRVLSSLWLDRRDNVSGRASAIEMRAPSSSHRRCSESAPPCPPKREPRNHARGGGTPRFYPLDPRNRHPDHHHIVSCDTTVSR